MNNKVPVEQTRIERKNEMLEILEVEKEEDKTYTYTNATMIHTTWCVPNSGGAIFARCD